MIYMTTPMHKNPWPGVMKCTILVGHSLVITAMYLVCMDMPRSIEQDDLRNTLI